MREDMSKVIVERPRLRLPRRAGSLYPRAKLKHLAGRDASEAPSRERLGGRYAYKRLNENLAPLTRYLRAQLGRPWNTVYSEVCAQLAMTSAVQKHVVDHLKEFVFTRVRLVEGALWGADRYGRPRRLEPGWRDLFYVCPRTGLLSVVLSDREGQRQPWRRTYAPTNPNVRIISASIELHRLDGVWFEVRFAPTPSGLTGWRVFDVLLQRHVEAVARHVLTMAHGRPGRPDSFAFSRRQLKTKERRRLLLETSRQCAITVR